MPDRALRQTCLVRSRQRFSMLKAVIFDLDGTVLETLPDLNACMNAALADYGYPPITREQTMAFVGHGGRNFALAALPTEKRDTVDEFYAHYCDIHVHCKNENTREFAGEEDCLFALKSAGLKLAVVTNKSQAAADVLGNTLLKKYAFDAIAGNRAGVPVKPDPALTLQILQELGVSPADAVFVGDGDTDVQTAQNAGMRSVSVLWGYRSREQLLAAGAERFAESFSELKDILLSL